MRTTIKLSIATLAFGAALSACGDARATDSATQDFQRDLELASSTTMNLAAPQVDPALLTSLETKPQAAPQPANTLRKSPGNRAVRSTTPTVRATPETDLAAVDEMEEQIDVDATAPVPEVIDEPVAVAPRPIPVVVDAGAGGGDYGTSGNGGVIFGGGGGRGGVIIRGGGVDGDRCELHFPRSRRGGGRGGAIYIPGQPTVPTTGGVHIQPRLPSRPTVMTTGGTGVETTRPRAPVQRPSLGAMGSRIRGR